MDLDLMDLICFTLAVPKYGFGFDGFYMFLHRIM